MPKRDTYHWREVSRSPMGVDTSTCRSEATFRVLWRVEERRAGGTTERRTRVVLGEVLTSARHPRLRALMVIAAEAVQELARAAERLEKPRRAPRRARP